MKREISELESRARLLKMQGDYVGALHARKELEECYNRAGVDVFRQATNLNHIAFLAVHTANFAEAERVARKCLDLYRPLSKESDEKLATYNMMLSAVLAESRKFDEAIKFGEEAVVIFERNHGSDNDFVKYRRMDIERMRNKDTQPYLDR